MEQNIQLLSYKKIDDEIQIEPKLTKDGCENRVKATASKSKAVKKYCSPAVLNEIVLDRVFEVLPVQDLKNCRLVCRQWCAVAEPVIRKSSVIVLTPAKNKSLEEFKKVFKNTQSDLPFKNLKIQDSTNPKLRVFWNFPQVKEILNQWGTPLQHLELDIDFPRVLNNNYILASLAETRLTTLILHCRWNRTHNIKIPLSHLTKIKILRLTENCVLDIGLEKEFKISPTEIELTTVKFTSNGKTVNQVFLNNFIDFRKAKKVKICHSTIEIQQIVLLSMEQSINLDSLELSGIGLLRAWEAQWNVRGSVFVSSIPWIQSNQMEFTSLNFRNCTLELSQLPSSIERLSLSQQQFLMVDDPMFLWEELSVFSMEPDILRNLKYLSLDEGIYDPNESCLHLFRNCTQLTAISVKNLYHRCWQMPRIKIEDLPPSIQIMEIESPYNVVGDGFHSLEMLILKNCAINADTLAEVMRKFAPRKVVVDTTTWGLMSRGFFKKCMKAIRVFQRSNDVNFWMGPVKFSNSSFKCYFKDYTAERRGSKNPKVISQQEFEEVRQLQMFKPDAPVFN